MVASSKFLSSNPVFRPVGQRRLPSARVFYDNFMPEAGFRRSRFRKFRALGFRGLGFRGLGFRV